MGSFEEYEKAVRSGAWKPTKTEPEHKPYQHPDSVFAGDKVPPLSPSPQKGSSWKSKAGLIAALLAALGSGYLINQDDPRQFVEKELSEIHLPDFMIADAEPLKTQVIEVEKIVYRDNPYKAEQSAALEKIRAWERLTLEVIKGHNRALDSGHKSRICITLGDPQKCFTERVRVNTSPARLQ